MNERVMQFRIGMFVIVAGLVLTMLIVWFGESPSLLRDHGYITVHYDEAPGVAEGIPVRKSGIRVGEVSGVVFDERPGKPDGVLVTLMLDKKFPIKEGSVPRITRSLIGDVTIDLLPGTGPGRLVTSASAASAPVIDGTITPDPSKALAAVTIAFERVGGTLQTIEKAADGIAKLSEGAGDIGDLLLTWKATGGRVAAAADSIDRFIKTNEADVKPAVANLKEVSQRLNAAFDAETQDSLRTGLKQFSTAASRLNSSLENVGPLFKDLGAPVNATPSTDFGQAVRRLNLVSSDLALLSQALRDPSGKLNTQGSIQRLITKPELYDNMNRFAVSGTYAFDGFKQVIGAFKVFAEKISRDPSVLARGALSRP